MVRPRACFFAKVRTREELTNIEFYAQDIQILSDLGYEVKIAIHPWELRPADLYFAWWWTWAFMPVTYAKLLRRPVIITGVFNCWNYQDRPKWQKQLIEYSVKLADYNIAISQLEYNELSTTYFSTRWTYSPLIIDTHLFDIGISEREDIIYTTATMVVGNAERKSIPELIKAATLVHNVYPDLKFILAGKYDSKYKRMIEDFDASSYIVLLGLISREEKIRYLQSCKIYLQPSRFEGFGLAILEALSCGTPVVTSEVGAVTEVVGNSAELVDGSSPESIAAGVIKLMNNDKLRMQLGVNGRKRAEDLFSYERRKNDFKKIIDELNSY
jgi:glycosyltransferase involved in cell wall biosynthesis